jgi:flagellar basal-body rod protein FlgB
MNDPVGQIEKFLDVTAIRQRLVAQNLANVDTPGYRTRDFDFRSELARVQTVGHSSPLFQHVAGLVARPDGNDVSVDRETLLLAESQLQFRVGVQFLRSELHRIMLAINEGRQG